MYIFKNAHMCIDQLYTRKCANLGSIPTSAQGSCWRVLDADVDSTFCWVVARLAHSDTETAVWVPAGCRTGVGTEVATGAGAWAGAAGWPGAGSVTGIGAESLGWPIVEYVSEPVDELFGGSKVESDAETGAWTEAEARDCTGVGTCIGTEVGALTRVEVGVWGMGAAGADNGTDGWFCAGTRAGVCAGAWVLTWAVAKTGIEAGAVGATVKSRPAAVVSPSTPIPQREFWTAGKTGWIGANRLTSPKFPCGAIVCTYKKKSIFRELFMS